MAHRTTPISGRPRLNRRQVIAAAGAVLGGANAAMARTAARLTVTPEPLPAGVPAVIRLDGLAPGADVSLRAEFLDGLGVTWASEATCIADRQGAVDLSTQAPVRGSYTVVSPMGLIWSAEPASGGAESRYFAPSVLPGPVSFTATVAGREVASTEIAQVLSTAEISSQPVPGPGVIAWIYRPNVAAPVPAVMVLGGSEGGLSPYVEYEAALLARHGFAALAVAYFGIGTLPPALADIPLEYFEGLIGWLQEQPGIDADRLAVIGHSRGGELALLLGATNPALKAVVSYVGSGLVHSSVDGTTAAWTLNGEAFSSWTYGDATSVDRATIAVERINGPVLLISGQRDLVWPSFAFTELAMDRFSERGHRSPYRHLTYRDAGHLIQAPYLPTTWQLGLFGGTAAGTALASADSWPRVLKILDDRLKR